MSDLPSNNNDPSKKSTSFAKSCALLTLAIILVYPLFALVGFQRAGMDGIWATAIAAGLCFTGAVLALIVAKMFQGSPAAVLNSVLLGMIFRTGVPLAGGMLLQQNFEVLRSAGVLSYVLAYYLFTLVVETLLSLKMVPRDSSPRSVATTNNTTVNSSTKPNI